jgi:glutamate--cysteine ligase
MFGVSARSPIPVVSRRFEERLHALARRPRLLDGARRGIEKESLRVTPDGFISPRPHPAALGSPLTNRYITTDFSEALLELITPPLGECWEAVQFLCDLHQYTCKHLDGELLWPMSMPCMIRSAADIPIASYGTSNVGRMKSLYRRGLSVRYGRYMQAISGIHYNYSVPEDFWAAYHELENKNESPQDFRSRKYLGLVRNVRRLDWLLIYLFGASPAVCKSFLAGRETGLAPFDRGTVYGPYATSLRMSNLGYQNDEQSRLRVSANSLDEYIADLDCAIRTPNSRWQALGIRTNGERQQLNANVLQIENEYYSTIRPKRVARSGERPTAALRRGGIEYVELRALDVSPFDPVGINQRQAKFLEAFLVTCLLLDSPPIDAQEHDANVSNHAAVATRGREPGLCLIRERRAVSLQAWGRELRDQVLAVCDAFDPGGERGCADAVRACTAGLEDPALTPSQRLLEELRQTGEPLFGYAMQMARDFDAYFRSLPSELNVHEGEFMRESQESLARQRAIEAADDMDFDAYLAAYFE